MELADRVDVPVLSLVDTADNFLGIEAEERGQAEAIARSIDVGLGPGVATIVGEGGSGGAIAVAACNRVLMLEHATYSVISPEGASSILWREATRAEDAATNMKITAQDLVRFDIINQVVPERPGGAHRDHDATMLAAGNAIDAALRYLAGLDRGAIRAARTEKFSAMGRKI